MENVNQIVNAIMPYVITIVTAIAEIGRAHV